MVIAKFNDSKGVTYTFNLPLPLSMFVGYLLGVFFTPYMYVDLQLTHWTNLFVYAWILFWPLALFFHFMIWFFVGGYWFLAFLFIIGFAIGTWAVCKLIDSWNLHKKRKTRNRRI